jgi:hypothetical protein
MLFGERLHEGLEIFLAADFAHVFGREVGVHARSVPVALDGFAIQFDIYFVFLAQTHHQIAGGPGVVRGLGGAFGENLEFPLALGDFRVDAFVVDTGGEAEIQMLLDDLSGHVSHVFVADTAVVRVPAE